MQGAGLDYGRRYAWTKDGASDLDRQRALYLCANANAEELRGALIMNSIPFVGLATLPVTAQTQTYAVNQRIDCMERDGWTLVDISTLQPQRIERDDWWGPRPKPREP